MTSRFGLALAALLVLGPAFTSVALAEDPSPADKPGWGMGPGMMGPGMMGPGMMGPGMGMMMGGSCPMMGGPQQRSESYTEGRLAFLKTELAITEAQESPWQAYAEALRKNLASMQDMHAKMQAMMGAKTPVARLEAHVAAMSDRLAALTTMKPALASLYEALDATQKQKADALLTGMGCMM